MSGGYDVVVVGAGSAGCALAARLTEDPSLRVLLLEAGGSDKVLEVQIPAALYKTFRTRRDWNYSTEPQPAASQRRVFWPRGKMLGGCSSNNAMIYIRGAAADYDEWAQLTGDPGWSYASVLPLFRRMEDNARGADAFHGTGGPLRVEDLRSPHPWSRAVVESAVAAGYPRNDDFNGARQEGAGLYQVTQRRGRRWSAADAYLHPAQGRPNLELRTGSHVTRVLLDGDRATGIEYVADGRLTQVHADQVVLAAGAIGSPQILQLSGIGPADHLRSVGVDVAHDLPGVGEGLQDHPLVPTIWHVREGKSLFRGESPAGYAQWFGARRGPLTSNLAEAGLFTRSDDALAEPDLQFHFLPVKYWQQAGSTPTSTPSPPAPCWCGWSPADRCGCARPTPPGRRPSTPATSPTTATSRHWSPGSRRPGRSPGWARCRGSWPRSGPPAAPSRPGRACARRCATPWSRCTTRSPPAGWAPTTCRWSTRSCACTASRACGWSTPR